MNANEIAPKANGRLQRIQTVSRLFRYFVMVNLVFNAGFFLLFSSASFSGITIRELLLAVSELLMFFWFWKLAQLFRLYERGLIFAAETIHCIKVLGVICLAGWLVLAALHYEPRAEPTSFHPPADAHLSQVKVVPKFNYRAGFLSFNFGTGIDFGLLFVGATVVLAAWIMDEGRKIQEEQELTV